MLAAVERRSAVMESIKRTWELNSLEVNGVALVLGYVTAAVLLYLTYIRVF
jgi:hypothetical protein